MSTTNELPPPPDLSKIVPDGWEIVTTGKSEVGDLTLESDRKWRPAFLGFQANTYTILIRRKPRPKKVRPLNAEEWPNVAHCVASICMQGTWSVFAKYHQHIAQDYFDTRATCHPPGFPADIRPLYVEEDGE